MAKCVLFGEEFLIPDSLIRNFIINKDSLYACEAAEDEFNRWYKKCSGIDAVLKGYYDVALDLVWKYTFVLLFPELSLVNIYDISEDIYINQIIDCTEVDHAYEYVMSDLEDIIDDKKEKMEYRAARKNNRNRFVGGGFGFSGAIKGSMEAGALNAASGLAHSSVNTIGNIGSALGASMKKSALYNEDTRDTLNTGVYLSIASTYRKHKQLINDHYHNYYEEGFNPTKALALFENAKKIPSKRKELLLQAVKQSPEENILAYIFINYPEEKEHAYQIARLFKMDFNEYVEDSFVKLYTESAKNNPAQAEVIKARIVEEMRKYGIQTSNTLSQINKDMLVWIIKNYQVTLRDNVNDQIIKAFREYDAPNEQKADLVGEYGFWELASEYGVKFSKDEVERILERYYSGTAKSNEHDALAAKRKLQEIMKTLSISESAIFDQLEKDCIARLCGNIDLADEDQCNQLMQKIKEYNALPKNKQKFLDKIQARLDLIWSEEDAQIFDRIYMDTDIYDNNQVQDAIQYIIQKGRTSNSQKYITALEACTPENIRRAKQFQNKNTKIFNGLGILLSLIGIVCSFAFLPSIVIAVLGFILMVDYYRKKKIWKILTINETQIHKMLLVDNPADHTSSVHKWFHSTNTSSNINKETKEKSSSTTTENEEANHEKSSQTTKADRTFNGVTYSSIEEMNAAKQLFEKQKEKEDIEKKRQAEEMSRTFNGVLYSSIEEMNEAKRLYKEQKSLKRKQKIRNSSAVASMICGIVAFPLMIISYFGILVWFFSIFLGIFSIIKKSEKKGFAISGLVFSCILLVFVIWGIASAPSEKAGIEEQQVSNDDFFEIVQLINDGKFDEAEVSLQKCYGRYGYSGADGFNKANLQRLLCDKQGKWDDEMQVILDFLEVNYDFKEKLQSGDVDIKLMISCAGRIIDKVSQERKQAAIDLIGQNLLDENRIEADMKPSESTK